MKVFEGTDLPDDFFQQVKRHIRTNKLHGPDATADGVLGVLGRSLTHHEKMAIVEPLHAGRLSEPVRAAFAEEQATGKR